MDEVAMTGYDSYDRYYATRYKQGERVVYAIEAESADAVRATLARDPWDDSHLVVESVEPWTVRERIRL